VSYREGLRGRGEARAVVEAPLGGKPQFAEVALIVEHHPNDEPGHVVFVNEAPTEGVPETYIQGIEEAARDLAGGGVLRGDPLINIRVTLAGGAHREEESTPAAFAMAVAQAFRDACGAAGLVLLEPVMTFEVVAPEEFLGGVLKDLRMRGAEVGDMEMRGGLRVITGKVPLSRMFEYTIQLRSLTQGRGTCSLEPREYGEVSRQDYSRLVGE